MRKRTKRRFNTSHIRFNLATVKAHHRRMAIVTAIRKNKLKPHGQPDQDDDSKQSSSER